MKSNVALIPCDSYDPEQVYEAVRKGFELLGGVSAFAQREEKVLLKPNVLSGAKPEKAVTTHPAVFEAVIRCFREEGFAHLTYGDSSGISSPDPEKNVAVCGLKEVADRYEVPLGDFMHTQYVRFPEGKVLKNVPLCAAVAETDALISICKMKTHALTNITGAIKNQYGCICGIHKGAGHARFPNCVLFSRMLCDINRLVKPRLFIMDGITAMEGNGPGNGDPVPMNLILMSADPVALDSVFARLVYVDPDVVPTCIIGAEEGLGFRDMRLISLLTPDGPIGIEKAKELYGNPSFDVNRKRPFTLKMARMIPGDYKDRPEVDLTRCTGCGVCNQVCPADGKAVTSGKGEKAVYDYTKCIRCYCCQEMCPSNAISRVSTK